jgi:hypothetical protein
VQDSPKPEPERPLESGGSIDLSEEILPWWRRSPPLAAGAALAIGLGTHWFAGMLGRVPLDGEAKFGYLLMLPLLLIVPAFSAAGLRLAWLAYAARESSAKYAIVALAVSAAIANWLAIAGFATALWRIFGH